MKKKRNGVSILVLLEVLLKEKKINAQNNNQLSPEVLVVSNITADQGPTMKRIRPRARGRAYRVLKRSSHVTIELDLKPGISTAPGADKGDEAAPPKRRRRTKPASNEATAAAKQETDRTASELAEDKPVAKRPRKRAAAGKSEDEGKKEEGASQAKPRAKKTAAKPKAGNEDKESKE